MGEYSGFELNGWKADGSGLPVAMKRAVQDAVCEADVEEYGTDCNEQNSFIMSFGSEYFGAYDTVCKALSGFAAAHEDVLLELYYSSDEAGAYSTIRFRGQETEEYSRVEAYPPFVRLTLPGESHPLPVLEFHYDSIDGSPDTSILVLLDTCLPDDRLAALEDSISAYIEGVPAWAFEKLIHDVLSAENIGHWILTPTHTFHI